VVHTLNLLVSACLLGTPCRYDGKARSHETMMALTEGGHTLIPVCPEVLGGLPTPRSPAEIQGSSVINRDGRDVTAEYLAGAKAALALAQKHHCGCAILKERSPSCGSELIYNGTFSGTLIPSAGIAAQRLMAHGIPVFGESAVRALPAHRGSTPPWPVPLVCRLNAHSPLLSPALDLVWRVFSEFEAPDYSEEGVAEFSRYIQQESMMQQLSCGALALWCCLTEGGITGVAALRPPNHISLLFVDQAFHRQGIGGALLESAKDYARELSQAEDLTVNSSPYAVTVYRKLGFLPTGEERVENGLRFTPMKYTRQKDWMG